MAPEPNNYLDTPDSCCGVYPDLDFEGLVIEHWPSGQLKFRGAFKKRGKRVGQHLCFWPNGILQEVSYWDEGYVCGTVIWFREDGSRDCERDYGEYGGITRSWIEKEFANASCRPISVYVYRDDKIVAKWIDPDIRKAGEGIDMDEFVKRAVKDVYPDA